MEWLAWPETTGQCFVYEKVQDAVWVATIEQKGDHLIIWKGTTYYVVWDVSDQFKYQHIVFPEKPEGT